MDVDEELVLQRAFPHRVWHGRVVALVRGSLDEVVMVVQVPRGTAPEVGWDVQVMVE